MAGDGQAPPDGGFVNVYKPLGAGSTQVVGRVRRAVRVRRVGHCGTLDPLAWGVLPLAIGRATRLSRFVLEMPKTYEAAVLFGVETPSHDLETEPTAEPRPSPGPSAVEQVLPAFTGAMEQRPPEYSAVRVGGVRAYRSARAGRRLDLQPRRVHVRSLRLVSVARIGIRVDHGRLQFGGGAGWSDALLAGLRIECSSGTYIRALARDLGAALGCGAMLFGLIRTRVGPFTLSAATEMWQLASAAHEGFLDTLLYAPDTAVEHLPSAILSDMDRVDFGHGRPLTRAAAGLHRLYDGRGDFLGLAHGRCGCWTPRLVWTTA
ncbi:MAG: tRNA pseudouridine(55) synthase TruB [Chloroflexi bacterium]|nr:tRNA pseudouridine(55) synthase TruB [Chloroflexota bacterium]MCY3958157.1 tRNA pseudouridine(55) synthase TruB [Chloroflexota bacterium]